jgi:hypothetical protein
VSNIESKVAVLLDQTAFLLEKHKESKTVCENLFNGLLTTIDQKMPSVAHDPEEKESLENIHTLISEQAERVLQEAQFDIDELARHLESLELIKDINNPEKAQKLLSLVIDDEEEILDTETFKETINQESSISKEQITTMINDIKDAINEGSAKEVEIYLESLIEGEDDDNDDEFDGEENEDEEEGLGCGGCTGGGCGSGCGSGCGKDSKDLFEALSDEEDDRDAKISKKKGGCC